MNSPDQSSKQEVEGASASASVKDERNDQTNSSSTVSHEVSDALPGHGQNVAQGVDSMASTASIMPSHDESVSRTTTTPQQQQHPTVPEASYLQRAQQLMSNEHVPGNTASSQHQYLRSSTSSQPQSHHIPQPGQVGQLGQPQSQQQQHQQSSLHQAQLSTMELERQLQMQQEQMDYLRRMIYLQKTQASLTGATNTAITSSSSPSSSSMQHSTTPIPFATQYANHVPNVPNVPNVPGEQTYPTGTYQNLPNAQNHDARQLQRQDETLKQAQQQLKVDSKDTTYHPLPHNQVNMNTIPRSSNPFVDGANNLFYQHQPTANMMDLLRSRQQGPSHAQTRDQAPVEGQGQGQALDPLPYNFHNTPISVAQTSTPSQLPPSSSSFPFLSNNLQLSNDALLQRAMQSNMYAVQGQMTPSAIAGFASSSASASASIAASASRVPSALSGPVKAPPGPPVVLGGGITFPHKLHELLQQTRFLNDDGTYFNYGSFISWQPHGKAFKVTNSNKFAECVMPKFFKQTKFSSFQRQLNLYGFIRLYNGLDKGCYYHPHFIRDQPHFCSFISRVKINGKKKRIKTKREDEPNFYEDDQEVLQKKMKKRKMELEQQEPSRDPNSNSNLNQPQQLLQLQDKKMQIPTSTEQKVNQSRLQQSGDEKPSLKPMSVPTPLPQSSSMSSMSPNIMSDNSPSYQHFLADIKRSTSITSAGGSSGLNESIHAHFTFQPPASSTPTPASASSTSKHEQTPQMTRDGANEIHRRPNSRGTATAIATREQTPSDHSFKNNNSIVTTTTTLSPNTSQEHKLLLQLRRQLIQKQQQLQQEVQSQQEQEERSRQQQEQEQHIAELQGLDVVSHDPHQSTASSIHGESTTEARTGVEMVQNSTSESAATETIGAPDEEISTSNEKTVNPSTNDGEEDPPATNEHSRDGNNDHQQEQQQEQQGEQKSGEDDAGRLLSDILAMVRASHGVE